jgi:Na+-transporting methylmalonyl-CoA/oxaloacetate decarboxylase beta subunit
MGGMMSGTAFLRPETILAFMLGAIAFSPDTAAGVLLG